MKAKSRRESRNAADCRHIRLTRIVNNPIAAAAMPQQIIIQVHATTPFLPLEHAVWPATEGIVQPHGQYRHLRGQRDSRKGETKAVTTCQSAR